MQLVLIQLQTEYIKGLLEFKNLNYCTGSKYVPICQMAKADIDVNLE